MLFRVWASLFIPVVFNAVHKENEYRPWVADSFPLPTGPVQTAKEQCDAKQAEQLQVLSRRAHYAYLNLLCIPPIFNYS